MANLPASTQHPREAVTRVFFFGRTIDDYLALFSLSSLEDLKGSKILDVAAGKTISSSSLLKLLIYVSASHICVPSDSLIGPSSFCRQARAVGIDVTPVDPLYTENDPDVLYARGMEDINEFKKERDSGNWNPSFLQKNGLDLFLARKKEALGTSRILLFPLSYHLTIIHSLTVI